MVGMRERLRAHPAEGRNDTVGEKVEEGFMTGGGRGTAVYGGNGQPPFDRALFLVLVRKIFLGGNLGVYLCVTRTSSLGAPPCWKPCSYSGNREEGHVLGVDVSLRLCVQPVFCSSPVPSSWRMSSPHFSAHA